MVGKYRLLKSTLGVVTATHIAMSVPEGSILEIHTAPEVGDRTVEVLCNGGTIVMFVRDITERAEKL